MTTKTTLLAAASLAALAFAGAAQASEITAVTIGDVGSPLTITVTGATPNFYYLASTAVQPTTATNFTAGAFTATLAAGTNAANVPLAEGTYDFRFDLAGTAGAVWATAVTGGNTALSTSLAGPVCTPTSLTVVDGGGAGQNYAVIRAVLPNTCAADTRPTALTLSKPLTITSAGTVTINGAVSRFGTTGTVLTGVDNPAGVAKTIVKTSAAYVTSVTADAVATNLSLSSTPIYSALSTAGGADAVIGAVRFQAAANPADSAGTNIYAGINENALPAATYTTAVTASGGDFAKLNMTIGGTPATEAASVATLAGVASGAAANVVLVADSGTPATTISNTPITYSATVTPSYGALAAAQQLVTLPSAVTGALQGLGLEGTNLMAAWFSGTQAQSQSQVRLSNTGTTAAPVQVRITNGVFNFNGNPTNFNDTTCATSLSVPADGDLVLTSQTVFNCFGAFLRGDLLITVQADGGTITGKMRNTSSTGTFETTLGRYSGSTVAGAAQ